MRISDWSSDVCSSELQGQYDAAFARQYRMAGGEHQTQQVVADVVVEPVVESGRGHVLLLLQFARYFRVLAPLTLAAAQAVDRSTLGGGHLPGGRFDRHAGFGPALPRGPQRVPPQLPRHP